MLHEVLDNEPDRKAMHNDYSKGVAKLTYRGAPMSRIILETERLSLVAERNGLRIEKEIFWRGYQHYVYAVQLE